MIRDISIFLAGYLIGLGMVMFWKWLAFPAVLETMERMQ